MKLLWRAKMSTLQDGGEEVEEGAVYHVTLRRVQIQQAANKGARWLGNCLGDGERRKTGCANIDFCVVKDAYQLLENREEDIYRRFQKEPNEVEEDELPPEHTVSQYETCKIRTIKAGTLEKLVENLLTSFGDNDFTYISIFLSTYKTFSSTNEVLELLLNRYGNLATSSCEEDGSQISSESSAVLQTAIASILRAWLDQCSEDFREPPNHPSLMKLLDYLKSNMPGSDPEKRAQNLLERFQNQEVEHDVAFYNASLGNLCDEEELDISNLEEFSLFEEDLVAEQLTYMDAKLFKNVVPYHCLGRIWSQRDKKENKHLASTIRATISQFNTVTKCVISTILKGKELKTQQRAKIIEKWIYIAHPEFQVENKEKKVSSSKVLVSEEELLSGFFDPKPWKNIFQECRILKNFSSLKAIISALQSSPIYRLKKTWACVPKDLLVMFEELSEIFSDHDNYLTTRELLMKEGTSKFANLDSSVKENQKRTQKRLQVQKDMGLMQGTVPYLGTFLTDLIMLDTALPDYVEGGLINFEKRRREFEVIAQIKLLQSACNNYCMTPDRNFIQWFWRQQHLSEDESYRRASEIEAAADACATSPRSRKSVVKRFSLLILGSEVVTSSTPSKEQPKSAPGGSSGESTDSASVSSSEFNHSESEDICPAPTGTPDEPQKKLSEPSSSSSVTHPMDPYSSGVSSLSSCPSPLSSNDESNKDDEGGKGDEGSEEGDDGDKNDESNEGDSGDKNDEGDSGNDGDKGDNVDECDGGNKNDEGDGGDVNDEGDKGSVSLMPISPKAPAPVYNQQNEDSCIIRISVENNIGNLYKSILLTSQDKAPAVIRRAMVKHSLESEAPEDYELVQVIAEDKELVIPGNANVFYAMNTKAAFDFVLRKKTPGDARVKMRSRCSLTLPSTGARRRYWGNRTSKITL